MKTLNYIAATLATVFITSCGGGEDFKSTEIVQEIKDTVVVVDTLPVFVSDDTNGLLFGFCNEAGDQILADEDEEIDFTKFTKVLAHGGTVSDLKYVKKKEATPEDNGRRNYYNFDNAGGELFSVKGQKVSTDHPCIMMTDSFYRARKNMGADPLIKNHLDGKLKSRIEKSKGRKIKDYQNLLEFNPEDQFYLIDFGRKGDSALVSLIFVNGDQLIFYDYPALYNEISTWRVDDGGDFGIHDYYKIVAAFDRSGRREIIVNWSGAEGDAIEYMVIEGNEIISLMGASFYSAPQ